MELEPDPAHSQRPPPNLRPPSKRASTSRGGTIGKHFKLKKQLTRMNTKGFKDKLKVRMLEKPGSVVVPVDPLPLYQARYSRDMAEI